MEWPAFLMQPTSLPGLLSVHAAPAYKALTTKKITKILANPNFILKIYLDNTLMSILFGNNILF